MRIPLQLRLLLLFWATNFFLHFAWELLQIPFFEGMMDVRHGAGVWMCTLATFGDTGIALAAYLGAAWSARSLTWFHSWALKPMLVYFSIGIVITVVFEFLATEVLGRWTYAARMPTLPLIEIGLTPLLQWLFIPMLSLVLVRLMYFGLLFLSQESARRG